MRDEDPVGKWVVTYSRNADKQLKSMPEKLGYTQTTSRIGFCLRRQPLNLEAACIAQLIQVELLRHRLRLL